jgi:hypothetical protein
MAIACLDDFTFGPFLLPERSFPALNSFITLDTLLFFPLFFPFEGGVVISLGILERVIAIILI